MVRRAESIDATRRRITEAAVRLHTTIGPASTTVSAIAEEAGVTRLTVYRHFPDLGELFAACRAHWEAQHPPPDIEAWRRIEDRSRRARHAFRELYGWYREHGDDLYPIMRDLAAMPAPTRRAVDEGTGVMAEVLLGEGSRDASTTGAVRRLAVARHLLAFETWRSLAVDQGLADEDVVDLAVTFLLAAGQDPEPGSGSAPPGPGRPG